MENFFLIPKDGRKVRDPLTGKELPEKGASKPQTAYWLRRVRDEDVTVGEEPAVATTNGKTALKSAASTTAANTNNGDAQ